MAIQSSALKLSDHGSNINYIQNSQLQLAM